MRAAVFCKLRKDFYLSEVRLSSFLLAVRCLFHCSWTGLHTDAVWRGALHAAHRTTLNDEIFAGDRKSDGVTGNMKGPEKGNRGGAAALKYCFVPLLPRLLHHFYGRMEQWRIPDVIVSWQSLRKSPGKRGKCWKEFDKGGKCGREEGKRREGLRAGEKGVCWKSMVYASGDDHSPLITRTIVQGQQRRYTWESEIG